MQFRAVATGAGFEEALGMHPMASLAGWIGSTSLATVAFWSVFGACVDPPLDHDDPQARVVASWDPVACGEPHRVVVELEDDQGIPLTGSAPCAVGELALDAPRFGLYRGTIYAWTIDPAERLTTAVAL